MSNRIKKCFASLEKRGHKAFVAYLTAGYPDMERSEADIRTALRCGVDVLEAGVPFSDPTADGPVIQAAGKKALESGANLRKILAMLARVRADYEDRPIILFSYANPLFAYGYENLCADAAEAGVDGVLVVDMPFEESGKFRKMLKSRGLVFVPLIAPTTPPERVGKILSRAEGFVYYIMVCGVTGARENVAGDARQHISLIREKAGLPVAAGFGISNGTQAGSVAGWADGVVVGSALVKAAGEGRLAGLASEIASALHS